MKFTLACEINLGNNTTERDRPMPLFSGSFLISLKPGANASRWNRQTDDLLLAL